VTSPGSVEIRPRRLTLVCRTTSAGVVVVFAVLAVLLPEGSTGGKRFGLVDQLAFFTAGLLVAAGVYAFTRARVRADGQGLWVRSVLRERFYPWGVVVAIAFDEGTAWATADLQDDDRVALLAVQANDGARAVRSVSELRRLLVESRTGQQDREY
jgi:hypothetical protein